MGGASRRLREAKLRGVARGGLRSGLEAGRKNNLAPSDLGAHRLALVAVERSTPPAGGESSRMTMSSDFRVLTRSALTEVLNASALIGPSRIPGAAIRSSRNAPMKIMAVPVRHSQSLAAVSPATQRRHVGPRPGLIEEDQALRRDPVLMLYPLASPSRDGETIAFAGDDSFF